MRTKLGGGRRVDPAVEASRDLVSALERCDRLVKDWTVPSVDVAQPLEKRQSTTARRRRARASPAVILWKARHSPEPLYAKSRLVLFYFVLALLAAGVGLMAHLLA